MGRIQVRLNPEVLQGCRTVDHVPVHIGSHRRGHSQRWAIGRIKGSKVAGGHFGRAIAPEQLVVKVQANLGDHEMACHNQRTKQIISSIVLKL